MLKPAVTKTDNAESRFLPFVPKIVQEQGKVSEQRRHWWYSIAHCCAIL